MTWPVKTAFIPHQIIDICVTHKLIYQSPTSEALLVLEQVAFVWFGVNNYRRLCRFIYGAWILDVLITWLSLGFPCSVRIFMFTGCVVP